MLTINVSDWPMVKFDEALNVYFPLLPKEVENYLILNQIYAYRMSITITNS